jgi:hypothetical protein
MIKDVVTMEEEEGSLGDWVGDVRSLVEIIAD